MDECNVFTNNYVKLLKQIKIQENFSSVIYLCSEGYNTIAFGRNLDTNPITEKEFTFIRKRDFNKEPMTETEATFLLQNDIENIRNRAIKELDFFIYLSEVRQCVIINMIFNLGFDGFNKFKNTIKYINANNFEMAAIEMLDSKWFTDTKTRAVELSEQMRENKFQEKAIKHSKVEVSNDIKDHFKEIKNKLKAQNLELIVIDEVTDEDYNCEDFTKYRIYFK